jgi:hypothetical protein
MARVTFTPRVTANQPVAVEQQLEGPRDQAPSVTFERVRGRREASAASPQASAASLVRVLERVAAGQPESRERALLELFDRERWVALGIEPATVVREMARALARGQLPTLRIVHTAAAADALAAWEPLHSAILACALENKASELTQCSPRLSASIGDVHAWLLDPWAWRGAGRAARELIADYDERLGLAGLRQRFTLALVNDLDEMDRMLRDPEERALATQQLPELLARTGPMHRRFLEEAWRGFIQWPALESLAAPELAPRHLEALAEDPDLRSHAIFARAHVARQLAKDPGRDERPIELGRLYAYLASPSENAYGFLLMCCAVAMEARPKEPFLRDLATALEQRFEDDNGIRTAAIALLTLLEPLADHQGRVSWDRLRAAYGESAVRFLRPSVVGSRAFEGVDNQAVSQKVFSLSSASGALVGRSLAAQRPAAELPLLAEAVRLAGGASLEGVELIAVQHLKPNTDALLAAMESLGLSPADATLVGKPYSTDGETALRLASRGYRVTETSLSEREAVEPTRRDWRDEPLVRDRLRQVAVMLPERELPGDLKTLVAVETLAETFKWVEPETSTRRFLLLDDGGYLTRVVHDYFPEYAHLCTGVEQTEAGVKALEGIELKMPVLTVARTLAKKLLESIAVAHGVVEAIHQQLHELHPQLRIEPKEAVVLGYGALGREIARSLRERGYDVHVYDVSEDARRRAEADGMHTHNGVRDRVLAHAHLLVTCTPATAVALDEMHKLPKRVVAANAGSGMHGFGAHVLPAAIDVPSGDPKEQLDENGRRSRFGGFDVELGTFGYLEERFHRIVRDGDHELLALGSGAVVNMRKGTPDDLIQITLAMLLVCCATHADYKEAELHELPREIEDRLVRAFLPLLTEAERAGRLSPEIVRRTVDGAAQSGRDWM